MNFLKIVFLLSSLVSFSYAGPRPASDPKWDAYADDVKQAALQELNELGRYNQTAANGTIKNPMPALNQANPNASKEFRQTLADLDFTFDYTSDFTNSGRAKIIHTYGTAASVDWVPEPNLNASGIFSTGALGVMRISVATDPAKAGYIYGFGWKLLISGKPSKNIVAMKGLDGQGTDSNPARHPFSNLIPPATSLPLKVGSFLFALAHRHPNFLPVGALGDLDRQGNDTSKSGKKRYPVVRFVPNPELTKLLDTLSAANPGKDFREIMAQIPVGTELYTIYGSETQNGNYVKLGKAVLKSQFIASTFGDESLFIQHMRSANGYLTRCMNVLRSVSDRIHRH